MARARARPQPRKTTMQPTLTPWGTPWGSPATRHSAVCAVAPAWRAPPTAAASAAGERLLVAVPSTGGAGREIDRGRVGEVFLERVRGIGGMRGIGGWGWLWVVKGSGYWFRGGGAAGRQSCGQGSPRWGGHVWAVGEVRKRGGLVTLWPAEYAYSPGQLR